jgi:hypothetical protein
MSGIASTYSMPSSLKRELENNVEKYMARMYGEKISHRVLLFVHVLSE